MRTINVYDDFVVEHLDQLRDCAIVVTIVLYRYHRAVNMNVENLRTWNTTYWLGFPLAVGVAADGFTLGREERGFLTIAVTTREFRRCSREYWGLAGRPHLVVLAVGLGRSGAQRFAANF